MKKLLLVFGIAGFLTACNNDGASSENMEDSVMENVDSSFDAKIDSLQDAADSVKENVENSFDKADSTVSH